ADIEDVPEAVREKLEFILVDTVDEVLAAALGINGQTASSAPSTVDAPAQSEEPS
ncbi:MAG: hypothetical protein KDC23_14075, partial [Actinobacteria bacterium]|nr:hypothetical protein [Actinomycetota bacterium]